MLLLSKFTAKKAKHHAARAWFGGGGFAFGKDIFLSACQASLPISEENIRTRFRFAKRVRVDPPLRLKEKSKAVREDCFAFLCKGYKKDIFAVLLTGFELHRLSYILFGNNFRYCESNIRCLFGCQKNRCGNIQTQYNHYRYAFQSRYINSPRNLSTNDQNRN